MIIKKKKDNNINTEPPEDKQKNVEQEPVEEEQKTNDSSFIFDKLSDIQDRQERRRGDRRRGYRRIEDRSLVSRAHEEAKVIKETAQHDGFIEGVNEAKEEVAKLSEAINSIMNVKMQAYEYYKDDIVFIALEIAKKILSTQVELEPETVVEIASDIIKNLSKEDNSITVSVNPSDEDVIRSAISEGKITNRPNIEISVSVNDNVERGSCMVQTQSGQIDARFSSQLAIIKKAFEEGF